MHKKFHMHAHLLSFVTYMRKCHHGSEIEKLKWKNCFPFFGFISMVVLGVYTTVFKFESHWIKFQGDISTRSWLKIEALNSLPVGAGLTYDVDVGTAALE